MLNMFGKQQFTGKPLIHDNEVDKMHIKRNENRTQK